MKKALLGLCRLICCLSEWMNTYISETKRFRKGSVPNSEIERVCHKPSGFLFRIPKIVNNCCFQNVCCKPSICFNST